MGGQQGNKTSRIELDIPNRSLGVTVVTLAGEATSTVLEHVLAVRVPACRWDDWKGTYHHGRGRHSRRHGNRT